MVVKRTMKMPGDEDGAVDADVRGDASSEYATADVGKVGNVKCH